MSEFPERLTIFTPTFNRAYCLGTCYESLKKQTCKDFSWLIIDDGSNDGQKNWSVPGWRKKSWKSVMFTRRTRGCMGLIIQRIN